MPKSPLTALQRRAHQARTLDRAQATRLMDDDGLPFVHVGHERYLTLPAAVLHLGTDEALVLARDKRSLLYWPGYYSASISALVCALAMSVQAMTPEERTMVADYRQPEDLYRLDVNEHSSAVIRQIQQVAQDLHERTERERAGEDWRAVWRLQPEQLARMLSLLSMGQAAILLLTHPDTPDDLTLAQMREVIAEYITSPHTRANDTLRLIKDGLGEAIERQKDPPAPAETDR